MAALLEHNYCRIRFPIPYCGHSLNVGVTIYADIEQDRSRGFLSRIYHPVGKRPLDAVCVGDRLLEENHFDVPSHHSATVRAVYGD